MFVPDATLYRSASQGTTVMFIAPNLEQTGLPREISVTESVRVLYVRDGFEGFLRLIQLIESALDGEEWECRTL